VLTQPYKSFYYALKEALKEAGVTVYGNMKLRKVPHDAEILFTHYAKPLEKIIAKTAKKSNNLYARHLLLFLGAKLYGAPATVEKGRRAVVKILRSHGALASDPLKIDNGSGLSRSAKLDARILAKMLDSAYERYGERWMRTLSIAGVDGTIKKRFRGTVVRNRAWMKTGTLKHAKNIAGYVKSRTGRIYTVVIIVNTRKGKWKAAKLEDEIIQWLVTYKGRGSVVPSPKRKQITAQNRLSKTLERSPGAENREAYFIQAGSFSQFPTEQYLSKIREQGFSYKVEHSHAGYKVLIGPFSNEADARTHLSEIRIQLSNGAFIFKEAIF
jgi:D-alanyl-D-alanine carboxypeptidase/D-alanyl-D-alanine-endopeptidase (penicillin-binding protein 4)